MPSLFESELKHSKYFCDLLDQLNQEFKDPNILELEVFAKLNEAWGQIRRAQAWTTINSSRSNDAAWQCCRFAIHCHFNSENILAEYDGFSFQSSWLEDAKGLVPRQNVEQFLAINQSAYDLMSSLDASKQLLPNPNANHQADLVSSLIEIVTLNSVGENFQAIQRLNALCESIVRKGDTDSELLCLRLLAVYQLESGNNKDALFAAKKAIEILEDSDTDQLIEHFELYVVYARCLFASEQLEEADLECERVWDDLSSTSRPFAQNINLTSFFQAWANCSRKPKVESCLNELIEHVKLDSKAAESSARILRSRIHMRNGNLAESHQDATMALEIAISIKHKEYRSNAETQIQALADLKVILQSDDPGEVNAILANIRV